MQENFPKIEELKGPTVELGKKNQCRIINTETYLCKIMHVQVKGKKKSFGHPGKKS